MKIGMLAVDSNHPNLALMKLSRYHKSIGDKVEWYTPFEYYDRLYVAKIFSFTPDYMQVITNAVDVEKGGTGYDLHKELPSYIDKMQPDYCLYPSVGENVAYGFLTRGCINNCPWCIVPKKEGSIRPYMDIEEIAIEGRNKVVLLDNNILASDYGLGQIEKIVNMKLTVDFNQALDARLVTDDVASLLARVKWMNRIRFGCDTPQQIGECERAMSLINNHGYNGEYFLYCILMNFDESFRRVDHWRGMNKVYPYCQPYMDFNKNNQLVPQWQKDLARWANRKELYNKVEFKDFEPRKGFVCSEYFNRKL